MADIGRTFLDEVRLLVNESHAMSITVAIWEYYGVVDVVLLCLFSMTSVVYIDDGIEKQLYFRVTQICADKYVVFVFGRVDKSPSLEDVKLTNSSRAWDMKTAFWCLDVSPNVYLRNWNTVWCRRYQWMLEIVSPSCGSQQSSREHAWKSAIIFLDRGNLPTCSVFKWGFYS